MTEQANENQEQNDVIEAIKTAFIAAIESEKEEDATKMDMIQAGATFKNVTRLYNQFMVDAGLAVSKEEKENTVAAVLEGADLANEDEFNKLVEALVEQLAGSTEKSAAALIRAYAKKNELECFKKAKAAGTGKVGFAAKFYDFLAGNPEVTKAEAVEFIQNSEFSSDNVRKHQSHYLAIHNLVNRIAGVEVAEEAAAE